MPATIFLYDISSEKGKYLRISLRIVAYRPFYKRTVVIKILLIVVADAASVSSCFPFSSCLPDFQLPVLAFLCLGACSDFGLSLATEAHVAQGINGPRPSGAAFNQREADGNWWINTPAPSPLRWDDSEVYVLLCLPESSAALSSIFLWW